MITETELKELAKSIHNNNTPAFKALRSIVDCIENGCDIEKRVARINRQIDKGFFTVQDLRENAKTGKRKLIKNDEVRKAIAEKRNIGDTWVNAENDLCAYEYPQ